MKKKILATYFPQYYSIKINNDNWGDGFTDWDNVKTAKSQYESHYMPRIPQNNNYYSPLDENTLDWQIKLAIDSEIDGFNFYHYWFDGELVLEKPVKKFKEINTKLHYCFTWANESWTKQWDGNPKIIVRQSHLSDEKIWRKHLNYLIDYFKDDNYLKVNNKPIFTIYRAELIPNIESLMKFYNDFIKLNTSFDGIFWIASKSYSFLGENNVFSHFDKVVLFQPRDLFNNHFFKKTKIKKRTESIFRRLPWIFQHGLAFLKFKSESSKVFDYSEYCDKQIELINATNSDQNTFHSISVDWDNTARYKERFIGFKNFNLVDYKRLLKAAIYNDDKDFLFINAWNEWAESAYLEPDEKFGNKKLEILKNLL